MNILLIKSSIRYFVSHPLQTLLSILGIAIGIAVSTGIDTVNKSTLNGFKYSMNAVTGSSVSHIVSNSSNIDSGFYFNLRNHGFRNIIPVVELPVKVKNNTFILYGTDPFASKNFEERFSDINFSAESDISSLLSVKNSVIISRKTSELLKVKNGEFFLLDTFPEKTEVKVTGIIKSNNRASSYDHIIITDISTAQEISRHSDRISRIDIFDRKDEENIRNHLENGLALIKSKSRSETTEQMVESFQINLSALSLLALVVGSYLIYNTISFSVVRRKRTIGIYKALGVSSVEIFSLITAESLMLGLIGTAAGIMMGFFLAKGLVFFVSQTLNDLYFAITVNSVETDIYSIIKGLFLGIGASVLAGVKPSLDALKLPCAFSIKRSFQEEIVRKKIFFYTAAGLFFLIAAAVSASIETKNIIAGYFTFVPLIAGFTFLSPLAVIYLIKFFSFPKTPLIYKMGLKSITESLSRTVTPITALALAVAATIGIGITVESFRNTVSDWLDQRLKADVFISAPGLISLKNDTPLEPYLLEKAKKIKGVRKISFYREKEIFLNNKKINVTGFGLDKEDLSRFKFIKKAKENIVDDFLEGKGIFITEPFALRHSLEVGDHINFPFKNKDKAYKILGIYTDYSSDQGRVSFVFDEFSKLLNINNFSGISLYLDKNYDFEKIKQKITDISRGEELIISSNSVLKKNSMDIFDKTFAIADILQVLSIIVAFTGIVSALMSIMLEKEKETGILRAIGFHTHEIRQKVYIQTFFMGILSAALALPLGHIFSWLLINVINKRAFGWSIDFSISPDTILISCLVSVAGAVAAGIYPGFKMSKTLPSAALREE